MAGYDEIREQLMAGLRAAAEAQESGNLRAVEVGYEELDGTLPRTSDPVCAKLHIALQFWDGWIDARNHDWSYYKGISKTDWPQLARRIVEDLRQDREIGDERVLEHFDFRNKPRRPSVWTRLRAVFHREMNSRGHR